MKKEGKGWCDSPLKRESETDVHDVQKGDNSIRNNLSILGSESNVHGISRIVSDRPLLIRGFWLIAFLGLASFGIVQVTTIIQLYYAYPIKTSVKIAFEPLKFPAVTICNMNIIKKSQSGNLSSARLTKILEGSYNLESGYSSSSYPTYFPYASSNNPTNAYTTMSGSNTGANSPSVPSSSAPSSLASATNSPTESGTGTYWGYTTPWYDYWYDSEWSSWNDMESSFYGYMSNGPAPVQDVEYALFESFMDEYQQLERNVQSDIGHQIENMLIDCQFAGKKCDSPSKKIVTFDYGNCYTFQSPRYVSGSSGPLGGLSMTINLENHEALQQMTEGYGLRLVLHEVGSFPLPAEEGMTISGGYETMLGIKLTKIGRLGSPYGSCQDPLEYFKKNFVRYSTQGCLQTCWEKVALQQCDCIAGYMQSEIQYFHNFEMDFYVTVPENNDTSLNNAESYTTSSNVNASDYDQENVKTGTCYTAEGKTCYNTLRIEFLRDVSVYCDCPPACTQNVYTTTFSGRLWPHETKLNELKNESCQNYNSSHCGLEDLNGTALSSNFMKIRIYYEDLNFEVITEEPLYDVNQVIADVGGSLGLCLGFSLLCICEFAEAIVQIILVLKRKLHSNTTVESAN